MDDKELIRLAHQASLHVDRSKFSLTASNSIVS